MVSRWRNGYGKHGANSGIAWFVSCSRTSANAFGLCDGIIGAVSHYVFCIAFVPLSRNYLLMFNTERM